MLRAKLFNVFCLVTIATSFAIFLPISSGSVLLRRVTNTGEEIINLNPSLSGDGRFVAFESTADLAGADGGRAFRAIRADLTLDAVAFAQMGITRAVAPAISQDGSRVAFASHEDPLGLNTDRNSEIFLFDGSTLKQITNTTPANAAGRISDGNFQPSITDDGRLIAFASNRSVTARNTDQDFEIVVYDVVSNSFTQLTDSQGIFGATDAKISGDGSHVAFIRDTSDGQVGSRELLLHDRVLGSTITLATNQVLSMSYGRAISDDGLRIVYSSETEDNQSQVFVFDGRSNIRTQLTSLEARAQDVPLYPTISGDGKRITFATRRNPLGSNSDHSVELFLFDLPTGQLSQLTDSPSAANAEVVSSLNDDGSLVVFNFPRVLSGPVSTKELANNSEIYMRQIEARPAFGQLELLNGASLETEPNAGKTLAPESIAVARGSALANKSEQALASTDGSFPISLAGTRVEVNQRPARLLYISPTQVHFVIPPETEFGLAEVVLTSSEGFQSRTSINITSSAPGVFTWNGQGHGIGVILNADNLLGEPFDPTSGQLRLIVFATGARGSSQLSATILGRPATVESLQRSPTLPGLDEIHLLVPSELRGSGTVSLTMVADNRESNPVELTFGGSFERDVLINEVLADPPDGLAGDANRDGVRDASQDEFIELVNTTERDLDLSGYQLQTRGTRGTTDILRHRFGVGSVLPAGMALVVFGGGTPDPTNDAFGEAQIQKASTGGLSLVNSGGLVTLRENSGTIVTFLAYGGTTGLRGDQNESLTRFPDVTGSFVLHGSASGSLGSLFSPGTRVNGDPFVSQPAISKILVTPTSALLNVGGEVQFNARAVDENKRELSDVIFGWQSNNTAIATVDARGLAKAISPGQAQITATARGTQSAPVILTISSPTPTPTPLPSPSPGPTASPTPTPTVTPTPFPIPSPSPSPSTSPTPTPQVLISEFRTRGPNGASDEFVELYNKADAPIDIGGWKIRGSSNSGSITTRLTIAPNTVLPARGHFLATNPAGYSGSVTGDQSYSSGIANDGGIAVTLPDDSVVDQTGMSAGSAFREGIHLAPLPSDANQSYERKPGGLDGSTQDSNDNFADFQLLTPSDPQNLSSSPTPGPTPGPSPSPSTSPGPSPTPTVSPTPLPSPTPSVSPTPDPTPTPSPSPVPVPKIVISQVYGGGGNSGAPFRNDFIEIFNSGQTTVNLASWSVQYSSANGTTWSSTNLTPTSIAPGQYYLIQEASGGSSGASLPAPDALGTIAMAATAGKVALVNSTTTLTGACPSDNSIVDLVGYGSAANCFRGSGPTVAPGNTTSVSRKSNGCDDTKNNSIDFETGAPNPRNTMSPASLCSGAFSSVLISRLSRNSWRALLDLALKAEDSPQRPFKIGGQVLNSQNCLW